MYCEYENYEDLFEAVRVPSLSASEEEEEDVRLDEDVVANVIAFVVADTSACAAAAHSR